MSDIELRVKARVNPWVLSFAIVMILALITRLYQLGSFPYFSNAYPWDGAKAPYLGLYADEASRIIDALRFPGSFSVHEGAIIGTVATIVSSALFGSANAAYRLPEALASSLTAGVVFLAAKELFKRWGVALAAGLYFVAMVPALVYGRMIFYENLVALFFALAIYGIAKYDNSGRGRWLFLGALAAGLAPLGKADGVFVPLFFTLWVLTNERRKQKILPAILSWVPFGAEGVLILALIANLQTVLRRWLIGLVGREISVQYLLIQSMPSGYIVGGDLGYVRPDFWYLFAFIALGLLAVKGASAGKILAEALFCFVVVSFASFGIGSYYLIVLFPLFALAAGGGMGYLSKLGPTGALVLYAVLYAPLVEIIIGSVVLPHFEFNYTLSLLNDLLISLPGVIWLILEGVSWLTAKRRFPLVVVLLTCFFIVLLVGTPEIYSYYFLGMTQ